VLLILVLAGGTTVALLRGATSGGTKGQTAGPPSKKPNIVLILTDDQRWDELKNMPTVEQQIVGKGVTFVNGFVVNPLCCPSRTAILTGKYSHSTDVYFNSPPHGGFPTFRHEDGSTIATWLRAGGYRTALLGKYLNGYQPKDVSYVPPGWDYWRALALEGSGEGMSGYYDYTMSENGKPVGFGSAPSDYSTDVLTTMATQFIRSTPIGQPLMMYFAPRAPHLPATPAPRDTSSCPNLQPVRPPSYDQAGVSMMPAYVRIHPPLSAALQKRIDAIHLLHCQSLLGVDDAVRTILATLQQTHRLSNTLIVFASDNGYLLGEHRLTGKKVPYEESIRVPIVVRYDPVTNLQHRVDHHLVLNVDFAQTFAEVAGVSAPGAEGKSLLPLLRDPSTPWRKKFLIEYWQPRQPHWVPPYCAVRTQRDIYVEYLTGEEELYDLAADPYELRNLAADPADAALKSTLHAEMVRMCSPPPPGFTP
jgi:arylsulfatase A-like enzyme